MHRHVLSKHVVSVVTGHQHMSAHAAAHGSLSRRVTCAVCVRHTLPRKRMHTHARSSASGRQAFVLLGPGRGGGDLSLVLYWIHIQMNSQPAAGATTERGAQLINFRRFETWDWQAPVGDGPARALRVAAGLADARPRRRDARAHRPARRRAFLCQRRIALRRLHPLRTGLARAQVRLLVPSAPRVALSICSSERR